MSKLDPLKVLEEALTATNEYYSPGIEIARLDAAEVLMTHPAVDADSRVRAQAFLEKIADGKNVSAGMVGRVRAARILLGPAAKFGENLQQLVSKKTKETK